MPASRETTYVLVDELALLDLARRLDAVADDAKAGSGEMLAHKGLARVRRGVRFEEDERRILQCDAREDWDHERKCHRTGALTRRPFAWTTSRDLRSFAQGWCFSALRPSAFIFSSRDTHSSRRW
jgi:hypothetical protein